MAQAVRATLGFVRPTRFKNARSVTGVNGFARQVDCKVFFWRIASRTTLTCGVFISRGTMAINVLAYEYAITSCHVLNRTNGRRPAASNCRLIIALRLLCPSDTFVTSIACRCMASRSLLLANLLMTSLFFVERCADLGGCRDRCCSGRDEVTLRQTSAAPKSGWWRNVMKRPLLKRPLLKRPCDITETPLFFPLRTF